MIPRILSQTRRLLSPRDLPPGHVLPRRAIAALLLVMLAGAGCGGSGSDAPSDNPTAPQPMILFTPARTPIGASISMRSGAATTATTLVLEILATDLVDVQTVDFTLTFPGNLLDFQGFRLGSYLGTDASVIIGQVSGSSFTALITRLAPGGSTGGGVIVSFEFDAVASGTGPLDFVEPEATDPFGQAIEGIDWIGGTLQVVL